MTRQDLLERYFELQGRLEGYPRAAPPSRTWDEWPPVKGSLGAPFCRRCCWAPGSRSRRWC